MKKKRNQLQIDYISITDLAAYQRQLRKPKIKQTNKAKTFLQEFSFVIPLVIDQKNTIVIGDFLFQAAKNLGYDSVPVVQINHLEDEQIRALRIAYDRISEDAEWDREALKIEFEELQILMPEIDLTLTGFEIPEIDAILNLDIQADTDLLNNIPPIDEENARIKLGDLYRLGEHILYCGDALEDNSYKQLLNGGKATMVFTDAPYNVKIDGHVGNSGAIQHREFKMASGEMSIDEFTIFLTRAHHQMAQHCKDGAILFSCMDWRHIEEMMIMARNNNLQFKNLCVWAKDNGGMGSLYRSQHELVFVLKNGTGKHINNVELGQHGRYRTNVWQYPGVNSFGGNRMNELKLHPTVKPVGMVADAILDCSNKGDLILDPFGGSGTTLIAAEKTKRKECGWGGRPPLGYEVNDRKLIINPEHTKLARRIFSRYLTLGCVAKLKRELEQDNVKSPKRLSMRGNALGGNFYSRGALYSILQNPIYIGKIKHKEKIFEGLHDGILDEEIWHQVQQKLSDQAGKPRGHTKTSSANILKGLLFDHRDAPYSPAFTKKGNQTYRYYVSQNIIQDKNHPDCVLNRLPAHGIEKHISRSVELKMQSSEFIFKIFNLDNSHFEAISYIAKNIEKMNLNNVIKLCVNKIIVGHDRINIILNVPELTRHIESTFKINLPTDGIQDTHTIETTFKTQKSYIGAVIIKSDNTHDPLDLPSPQLKNLVRGAIWRDEHFSGTPMKTIAEREGVSKASVRQIIMRSFDTLMAI